MLVSSIKMRITLALLFMSLAFVLIYIFLAKQTFENDKIAYVFDAQQNQVTSSAREFSSEFTKYFLLGKSILLAYNPILKKLNPGGQNLFASNANIIAIEMTDESINEKILTVDKKNILAGLPEGAKTQTGKLSIAYLGDNSYLLSVREASPDNKIFHFRMVIKQNYQFPKSAQQSFILVQGDKILTQLGNHLKNIKELPKDLMLIQGTSTQQLTLNGAVLLVSRSEIGLGDLSFYILTPKTILLAAAGDLYRKSIVFLIFTTVTSLLLAFLLAHGMTRGVSELTLASNEVAKSNFDFSIAYKSSDEIGLLASAFREMVSKIQSLLRETAEKARMESELKMAKAVQDTLFPKQVQYAKYQIKLLGRYLTASECGGDWWWYWQLDDKLFVIIADATGHGAPAALITSAARSSVATLERTKESDLIKIAEVLNHSLCQCANSEIHMSALILEIDMISNQINFINCSHIGVIVCPIVKSSDENLSWKSLRFLDAPLSGHLGKSEKSEFIVGNYLLNAGERLVLLTDGLTECKNENGEVMTERFFYNALINLHKRTSRQPEIFMAGLYEIARTQLGDRPLDDDQTAILIELG